MLSCLGQMKSPTLLNPLLPSFFSSSTPQSLCCLGSISRLYPISWEVHNLVKPGVTPCSLLLKQPMCPNCAEAEGAKSPMRRGFPEPQMMSASLRHSGRRPGLFLMETCISIISRKRKKRRSLFQIAIFKKNWHFSTRACFPWKFVAAKNYLKNWMKPKCQDTISSQSV